MLYSQLLCRLGLSAWHQMFCFGFASLVWLTYVECLTKQVENEFITWLYYTVRIFEIVGNSFQCWLSFLFSIHHNCLKKKINFQFLSFNVTNLFRFLQLILVWWSALETLLPMWYSAVNTVRKLMGSVETVTESSKMIAKEM